MMPGPHMPPPYTGRRQGEYHYQYPPQTHSPVHNPYAQYPHPQYHGHPHAPYYQQQWHHQYQPQQYMPVPPRPYMPPQQPNHSPMIVSSHPHGQPVAPMPRQSAPALTPPVQTPPVQAAKTPPIAATSTPSVTVPAGTSPATPSLSIHSSTPPPPSSARTSFSTAPPPPTVTERMPFYPDLPWHSESSETYPKRPARRRRRRSTQSTRIPLELPSREQLVNEEVIPEVLEEQTESQASTLAGPSDTETPVTSLAPSEEDSTHPTVLSSAIPSVTAFTVTTTAASHARTSTLPAVPIIPAVPRKATSTRKESVASPEASAAASPETVVKPSTAEAPTPANGAVTEPPVSQDVATPAVASPPAKPKSWADLVKSRNAAVANAAATAASAAPLNTVNTSSVNGFSTAKAGSLTDVLHSFSVDSERKLSFLEPRGLVNTGNMCYMNSILQTLVFCTPFYDFLDQVGKRAVHSFKSSTPLLDAMIMFLREFKVIDSAESVDKLRMRLKNEELEQYGEQFAPEYIYDVIKRLPGFSHMIRGHQQDAEEFLGFLLGGLQDECALALKSLEGNMSDSSQITSPTSEASEAAESGWMEVGPKQKPSTTRSSGISIDTPVAKIFGGKLRSELRVPGVKPSVTLEPYQPLQLDIGAPNVNNIVDALKGLTRSETLYGDFNSPRGPGTSATKQVFIETLPPVLILHLKRFQYDNAGGTQKIWKKVGYPLELEIPKEVIPQHKRGAMAVRGGMPKYRLIGVVYHHGKSAAGGHYTVDALRQDGREWIRMDDTIIRRVRSEDVAEGGAEEDPKLLAKALEQHKRDSSKPRSSLFDQMGQLDLDDGSETASEGGWKEVNGSTANSEKGAAGKKWSGVLNGTATPSTTGKRTPCGKEVKDNKVAYILFYQQIKQ